MTGRINRCSHCGCDELILGIDGKLYCNNCGMSLEKLDPIAEDSAKTQKREIILNTFKKMTDDELAYAYASVVKCSECPFQTKCQEHETVECLKRIKSWLEISPETKQTWKC